MPVLDFNGAKTLSQLETEQRSRATVDVEDIKARLNANTRGFVDWLFSGRAFCTKREARIGDVQGNPGASLSIALSGPDVGQWFDHSTEEKGDLIGLYMAYMGYAQGRNFQLALKEIASEFLGDLVRVERSPQAHTAVYRIAEKKEKLGTTPRADLTEIGIPVSTYRFFDVRGEVIASVIRYEPDGTRDGKTFRPWCFKVVDGNRKWVPGMPDLRPLFRVPDIISEPVVVLTEGEGKALSLAGLGIAATSAMGGAKAPIEKTDWSPLNGKTVVVWPDNDEAGFAYGRKAAEHLAAIGCEVLLVSIPAGVRPKWDAADCVAEGGDPHRIIAEAVSLKGVVGPTMTVRRRLLSLEEMEGLEPPEWLIDGILPERVLSMLWGISGSLKTFSALDMGLCVAAGLAWHGRPVKQGRVVYVAAEDPRGVAVRALGWKRTRGKEVEKLPFHMWPYVVSLATAEQARELVDAILAEDGDPVFVIIDTVMATFGSGNPNQPGDMNAYVLAANLLRERCSAHVMVIHHGGKNEEGHELGNHSLRNSSDTVIHVKRSDTGTIKLINKAPKGKQKNDEEFDDLRFTPVKVSFMMKGKERSTLVLNADSTPEAPAQVAQSAESAKLGKNEKAILDLLVQAGRPMAFKTIQATTHLNSGAVSHSLKNLTDKELAIAETGETGSARLWKAAFCS